MDNYKRKGGSGGGRKSFGNKGGGRSFGGGNKSFGNRGGGQSFGGGNRGFGGGRDRNRPPVQKHSAVCSDCENACEVPFKPSSDKPIFCNDCFKNKRDSRDSRGSRDSRDSRGAGSKPRFENKRGGDTQNYKSQFEALNTKLDKILKFLSPDVTEEIFGEAENVTEAPKAKKFKKAPAKVKPAKKEVNTSELKKVLAKTKVKKTATKKKAAVKKVVAKKAPAKKTTAKKVVKKAVAKKAVKKAVAKKVVKKTATKKTATKKK